MKTRLGALNAKRTIKSDGQWRTLQFLLGLPELLQLREVLVQYEDLGEAQGGHLRRSRLVIGQNFLRLTLTLSQLILFPLFLFNFSFASYHQLRSGMGMNRISQIIRTSHQLPVHRVLGTLITALAHLPSVLSHLFPRLSRKKKKKNRKENTENRADHIAPPPGITVHCSRHGISRTKRKIHLYSSQERTRETLLKTT